MIQEPLQDRMPPLDKDMFQFTILDLAVMGRRLGFSIATMAITTTTTTTTMTTVTIVMMLE